MNPTENILSFDNLDLDIHIRVQMKGDEPLFIAKDVCAALGIANSRDAISALDSDELVSVKATSGGQSRVMQTVTESGLYALIFKSRKEPAKRFRTYPEDILVEICGRSTPTFIKG